MAINKVIYNGVTLIDLTVVNVTPDKLAEGVIAMNAKGELIVGTLKVPTEAVLGEIKLGQTTI